MGLGLANSSAKLKIRLVVFKMKLKRFSDKYLKTPKQRVVGGITLLIMLFLFSILIALLTDSDTKSRKVINSAPARVSINAQGFLPQTLSVKKGTTVVWNNTDQQGHKVAANPYPTHESLPDLVSEPLAPEQTYSHTFNKVGTYYYHDDLNPTINGVIVVTP